MQKRIFYAGFLLFFLFGMGSASGAVPQNWERVESSPADNLNLIDVHMVSEEDGWIVGENGVILGWNGSNWSKVGSPTEKLLFEVDMYSQDLGWAVGRNGTILKWNGSSWGLADSPVDNVPLRDVDALSPDEAWIVGSEGVILRWDGTAWENFSSPTSKMLTSIDVFSENEGWIGGMRIFLRWNGNNWKLSNPEDFTPGYRTDIQVLSPKEVWTVGDRSIMEWDGETWSVSQIMKRTRIRDIDFTSHSEGWVAATHITDLENDGIRNEDGLVFRYDGESWEEELSIETPIGEVDPVSSGGVWAVGLNGLILRRTVEKESGFPTTLAAAVVVTVVISAVIIFVYLREGGGKTVGRKGRNVEFYSPSLHAMV